MILENLLAEFPQYGSDPVMVPVKTLIEQKKKLAELKAQASDYLIPVVTKGGKIEPGFDPDRANEVRTLAGNIEATRSKITGLESEISKLEAIAEKHGLERPLIKDLRSDIGTCRHMLEDARKEPGVALGNILVVQEHDIEKARQHPDYIQVVERSEQAKARFEPQIAKLSAALGELEGILNAGPA